MRNIKAYSIIIALFFASTGNILEAQLAPYEIPLDSVKYWIDGAPEIIPGITELCLNPDSSLDIGDCFWIYYGSAYSENYSPYLERTLAVSIHELIEQDSLELALSLCESMIEQHPGFLRPFYFMGLIYELQEDSIKSGSFYTKFYDLLSIPFYSGTGASHDSAFIVRSIDDEYIIIGELGYDMDSQGLFYQDGIPYDVLSCVSAETRETRDFYFNIYQPFVLGLQMTISDDEVIVDKKLEKQTKREAKKKRKQEKRDKKKRNK